MSKKIYQISLNYYMKTFTIIWMVYCVYHYSDGYEAWAK